MPKAYVKIWVTPGKEDRVREALLDQEHILVADVTAGEQDIITLVEADTYDNLLGIVIRRIREIEGITRTSTNLVLE